jgi:hypothetical protein
MGFNRFPDFGKELHRPFEVHENCYDCAGFYDGCPAWPANNDFACRKYHPLPDVPAGTWGQRFPATSRKLAAAPVGTKPEGQPDQTPTLPMSTPAKPRGEVVSRAERPTRRVCSPSPVARSGLDGERLCECGAVLPKRKRCCDECRARRLREAAERFKQRLGAVDASSGVLRNAHSLRSVAAGSP